MKKIVSTFLLSTFVLSSNALADGDVPIINVSLIEQLIDLLF